MALVIVGHPDAAYGGYDRVAGRGLFFSKGSTELVDLTTGQQAQAIAAGYTVNGVPATPTPDPFPQYLTEDDAASAIAGPGPLGTAARGAFETVVDAGTDLAAARPAGAVSVKWRFDAGVDVGVAGANIVNAEPGDTAFVASA